MGRKRGNRRGQSTSKAITPGAVQRAGGSATAIDPSAVQSASMAGSLASLLPRPPAWATLPFGPGTPLSPSPINPVQPETGRAEPRLYEYPVSWNIQIGDQRLVPFAALRRLANGISMFRRCIEVRKDEMIGLDWDITICQSAIEAAQRKEAKQKESEDDSTGSGDSPGAPAGGGTQSMARPAPANPGTQEGDVAASGGPVAPGGVPPRSSQTKGTSKVSVEERLRERLEPAIDAAVQFLRVPDRGNGLAFSEWLRRLLEEVFVIDALAIYPRQTMAGETYSFEILDGSTIKPLLDDRGGRPLPPEPAYQQILYGYPRGEFVAESIVDEDGNEVIPDGYDTDQLRYFRRMSRVNSPYGMSPVEQALEDGALYLKRHRWLMSEYTEGTSIAGLFTVDDNSTAASWFSSPDQLLEYENWYNQSLSGDDGARRSVRFMPPGVKPVEGMGATGSDAIAEKYKPEYDMWLLKLMVSHFDTTLPEIGFTDAGGGGLGSEGYHEGQEAVQFRKRRPIVKYVEEIITCLMRDHCGLPDELEFTFLGLEDEDDPSADDVDTKRQQAGVYTMNERRDLLGLPRYDFPEADMPMILTGRGVVFLEGASQEQAPGVEVDPPKPAEPGQPGAPGAAGASSSPPAPGAPASASGAKPANGPSGPAPATTPKVAELATYRKWATRTGRGALATRPFNFEHWTAGEIEAEGIDLGTVTFGPKAPRRTGA